MDRVPIEDLEEYKLVLNQAGEISLSDSTSNMETNNQVPASPASSSHSNSFQGITSPERSKDKPVDTAALPEQSQIISVSPEQCFNSKENGVDTAALPHQSESTSVTPEKCFNSKENGVLSISTENDFIEPHFDLQNPEAQHDEKPRNMRRRSSNVSSASDSSITLFADREPICAQEDNAGRRPSSRGSPIQSTEWASLPDPPSLGIPDIDKYWDVTVIWVFDPTNFRVSKCLKIYSHKRNIFSSPVSL